jgi:Xaa-Pro aminopeptidase
MPMAGADRFYPDFYPTHRTVQAGDVVMTEIALGYGLYFGKLWGTYFVGEPTPEYRRLFDVAVDVHDRVIDELRPGMTGRDVDRWLEAFRSAGCRNATALIGGWSTYNHAPNVGLVDPPGPTSPPTTPDFRFEVGQCLTIIAFPVIRDTQKGLWVGTTCVVTDDGLEKLHDFPVTQLRVVPV